MQGNFTLGALLLGVCGVLAMTGLGQLASEGALDYRRLERSVTVKGLSEREYPADVVIWPIAFTAADNRLPDLYRSIEQQTRSIVDFLRDNGIPEAEISVGSPQVFDKLAQQYGDGRPVEFRYAANRTVTVYSQRVDAVRALMQKLSALGSRGIALTGNSHMNQTEYLFTRLNEVKPGMIEETTRKARQVAQKFAEDSQSQLGRIRRASQGQFSISNRDSNSPHIKRVRVVSTVEFYLTD
jgi:hypothetical protein